MGVGVCGGGLGCRLGLGDWWKGRGKGKGIGGRGRGREGEEGEVLRILGWRGSK